MKFLRPALIVALLCIATAGAAFADDIHVIFDPTMVDPINANFNAVTDVTMPLSFTWGSCANDPFIPANSPLKTETACANFANLTGMPITQLTFTFLADPSIPGANTVSCDSIDPNLSQATCPVNQTFGLGDAVATTFFGGTPIPPSGPGNLLSAFFIGEDGVSLDDINKLSWTVAAPEPSTLNLLAAGVGLLGLGLMLAKR